MSQATSIEQRARPGCTPDRSIVARSSRPAPPGPISVPRASVSRAPSACSSPAPPSVHALPPTPTTIRVAPGVERPTDQFARTARRRVQGVHLGRRQQAQTRRLGELDHRRLRVEHAEPCGDGPSRGSGDAMPDQALDPGRARKQHVERPVAAVGHRQLDRRAPPASRAPSAIACAAALALSVPLNAFGAQTATGTALRRRSGRPRTPRTCRRSRAPRGRARTRSRRALHR